LRLSAPVFLPRSLVFCRFRCYPALIATAFAQKAFQRDELGDARIKLEARSRPSRDKSPEIAATLRRDADAAFARGDFRAGLQLLGQLAVVTPADGANWLRLARRYCKSDPEMSANARTLLERAANSVLHCLPAEHRSSR